MKRDKMQFKTQTTSVHCKLSQNDNLFGVAKKTLPQLPRTFKGHAVWERLKLCLLQTAIKSSLRFPKHFSVSPYYYFFLFLNIFACELSATAFGNYASLIFDLRGSVFEMAHYAPEFVLEMFEAACLHKVLWKAPNMYVRDSVN